jgi:sugar/nucleoside kinase (ribokinase family)
VRLPHAGGGGRERFLRDGIEFEIPIRKVAECVSTVGAGDTFMAGFLYGRMLGLDYVDSARTGSLLASMKVETSLGSTFPIKEKAALADRLSRLLREAGIL